MYAEYAFYKNDYGGTLTVEVFSRLSKLATAHIDNITNQRAKTATGTDLEAVKMAMCAVVEELDRQERGGIVTSESNDGISRSYAVGSVIRSSSQRIYDVAGVYLAGTNLLFAGV